MQFHFPITPEFSHTLMNSELQIVVSVACFDGCSVLCEYNQLSRQKGYAVFFRSALILHIENHGT